MVELDKSGYPRILKNHECVDSIAKTKAKHRRCCLGAAFLQLAWHYSTWTYNVLQRSIQIGNTGETVDSEDMYEDIPTDQRDSTVYPLAEAIL